MVTFTPLASSSAGCAYVLSMGEGALLLDCGIPFREIQVAMNFNVSKLDGCLITHSHADHCRAAKDILRLGVPCFASVETWNVLDGRFSIQGYSINVVAAKEPFQVGAWRVLPFEAVHDAPGTLGFVMDQPGIRCVYLTDSAYSKFTFEGMTHLFVECNHSSELMRESVRRGVDPSRYKRVANSHMSIERLCGFLAASDTSQLQEIHLLHLSDGNSNEAAFKKQIQEVVGCEVYVARKRT